MGNHGSHHTWGNIGYYLSAAYRFFNAIGTTRVDAQPRQLGRLVLGRDASLRLQHAPGAGRDLRPGRGSDEGSRDGGVLVGRPGNHQRLLRGLRGHLRGGSGCANSASRSCTSIRTTTTPRRCSAASGSRRGRAPMRRMAMAIAYVWITEGLYDKKFVAERSRRLRRVARLRARQGGRRAEDARMAGAGDRRPGEGRARTGPPLGQARRPISAPAAGATATAAPAASATGIQWARSLACLMAMQGMGRPGVNYGHAAVGHADRSAASTFPATPMAACPATSRTPASADQPVPAHAAAADVQSVDAEGAAAAHSRGDPRGQDRGLSVERQDDRRPVPEVHLSRRRATRRSRCSTSTAAPRSAR